MEAAARILELPLELLLEIFTRLPSDLETLSRLAAVCFRFRQAATKLRGRHTLVTTSRTVELAGLAGSTVRVLLVGGGGGGYVRLARKAVTELLCCRRGAEAGPVTSTPGLSPSRLPAGWRSSWAGVAGSARTGK